MLSVPKRSLSQINRLRRIAHQSTEDEIVEIVEKSGENFPYIFKGGPFGPPRTRLRHAGLAPCRFAPGASQRRDAVAPADTPKPGLRHGAAAPAACAGCQAMDHRGCEQGSLTSGPSPPGAHRPAVALAVKGASRRCAMAWGHP